MGMTIRLLLLAIACLSLGFYFGYTFAKERKDKVIAMLEELKKEIIQLPFPQREPEYMQGYSYCQMNILDYVIQEKINNLKDKKDKNNRGMKNG